MIVIDRVKVDVQVLGFVSCVCVSQHFHNNSAHACEVQFRFPLQPNATIDKLEVVYDNGKSVVGTVKEAEEAFETYDDGISRGNHTALLQQNDEKVYSINLGNVESQSGVTVTISYVTQLIIEDSKTMLLTLTHFIQNYKVVKSDNNNDAMSLHLRIQQSSTIKDVSSTTHTIANTYSDNRNVVDVRVVSGQETDLLSLEITMQNDIQPSCLLTTPQQPNQNSNRSCDAVAMVNVFPTVQQLTAASGDSTTEFIFLLDRSGSMSGSKIIAAQNTLQLFVRALPATNHVKFNIVSFGSNFSKLFEKSAVYSSETFEKASEHISKITANMGGTNIFQPLSAIFKEIPKLKPHQQQQQQQQRNIFLLTDGQVNDSKDVIELVREYAHAHRCFCIGVGNDVDRNLLNSVAKVCSTQPMFVTGSERLETKVMQCVKVAMAPPLTDINVNWSLQEFSVKSQTPSTITNIFSDEPLVLYALLQRKSDSGNNGSSSDITNSITISACRPHEKNVDNSSSKRVVLLTVPVSVPPTNNNSNSNDNSSSNNNLYHHMLACLFAKNRCEELYEQYRLLQKTDERQASARRQEMIELATQHNIVTPFTSLVACVPGTGATDTTMQLHIIDNNKTEAPATNTTSTTTTATTTKARKTKKRVQKQQSSPSSSAGLQAGGVRPGDVVMIKGRPCRIVEVATAKTGKHGHGKTSLAGIDPTTGEKFFHVMLAGDNVERGKIPKKPWEPDSDEEDNYGYDDDSEDEQEAQEIQTPTTATTAATTNTPVIQQQQQLPQQQQPQQQYPYKLLSASERDEIYTALIRLQQAQGNWHLTDKLCSLVRTPLQVLRDALNGTNNNISSSNDNGSNDSAIAKGETSGGVFSVAATVAAICVIEMMFSERRAEYSLLVKKAKQWLASQKIVNNNNDNSNDNCNSNNNSTLEWQQQMKKALLQHSGLFISTNQH